MQKNMVLKFLKDKKGAPPFSVDDNLFHTSTEGKVFRKSKKFSLQNLYFKEQFLLKRLQTNHLLLLLILKMEILLELMEKN